MFCPPELIFGGTEGVGSRFHVLRTQTHFKRYRGRRVPFSCFGRHYSFLAVPSAYGPVFMVCAPGHVFGVAECVESRFHVLRSRTRFRRNKWCQVLFPCFACSDSFSAILRVSGPFSCFTCSDSFSAILRASGHDFMFCMAGLVFSGLEGDEYHFHVLCSLARFRRYGGRRVSISCFALVDSFSAVPGASGPIFHVSRTRTHFRRYRGRQVPFSLFELPHSFSTVPREYGPVFMFFALDMFSAISSASNHVFMFALQDTFSMKRMASGPVFMLCLPRLVFSVVRRVSGPIFMFCAPGVIF
jgi:hypothetical protein